MWMPMNYTIECNLSGKEYERMMSYIELLMEEIEDILYKSDSKKDILERLENLPIKNVYIQLNNIKFTLSNYASATINLSEEIRDVKIKQLLN